MTKYFWNNFMAFFHVWNVSGCRQRTLQPLRTSNKQQKNNQRSGSSLICVFFSFIRSPHSLSSIISVALSRDVMKTVLFGEANASLYMTVMMVSFDYLCRILMFLTILFRSLSNDQCYAYYNTWWRTEEK